MHRLSLRTVLLGALVLCGAGCATAREARDLRARVRELEAGMFTALRDSATPQVCECHCAAEYKSGGQP